MGAPWPEGVFTHPVTAADLRRLVGNPLNSGGDRPVNSKYPNLDADRAPAYPLGRATFKAGSATTGFAPFADAMRRAGYASTSANTYVLADEADVRAAQARAEIVVDGIVGPQTWATVLQSDAGV